jgi:hypothetical protein
MQGWGRRWSLSNNRQAWPPEVAVESELEQAKKDVFPIKILCSLGEVISPGGPRKLKQLAHMLESGEENWRMCVCTRERNSETDLKGSSGGSA